MTREALLDELRAESRRYIASYVLFNQAVADHLGLHPTDVQCLNLLSLEAGPVTTGRIAELTGLTSGSATRLVDRLVKAGYATRERDPEDRRRVLVQLVPAAAARLGALWRELSVDWDALFDGDSETELALLIRHMRRTTELGRRQVAWLSERAAGRRTGAAADTEADTAAAAEADAGTGERTGEGVRNGAGTGERTGQRIGG